MNKKKLVFSVISIVLCVALISSGLFMWNSKRIHNVFDEMFVSVVMETGKFDLLYEANLRYKYPEFTHAGFPFVKEIGKLAHDPDMEYFFWGGYKYNMLDDREDILLSFHLDRQVFHVAAYSEIENTRCLMITYTYNYKTKTLEIEPLAIFTYDYDSLGVEPLIDNGPQVSAFLHEHNISRESIEQYRDYFLYDKLLTDWVNGNGKRSKYMPGNYGNFTIIDNTFANLGPTWQ